GPQINTHEHKELKAKNTFRRPLSALEQPLPPSASASPHPSTFVFIRVHLWPVYPANHDFARLKLLMPGLNTTLPFTTTSSSSRKNFTDLARMSASSVSPRSRTSSAVSTPTL